MTAYVVENSGGCFWAIENGWVSDINGATAFLSSIACYGYVNNQEKEKVTKVDVYVFRDEDE